MGIIAVTLRSFLFIGLPPQHPFATNDRREIFGALIALLGVVQFDYNWRIVVDTKKPTRSTVCILDRSTLWR